MIQVYRIPVPKERLRAMPKDERVLFLLLGYVANQLSMLQKLLTFATNRTPAEEVERHATGVQTQMLIRLTAGAARRGSLSPSVSSKMQWRRITPTGLIPTASTHLRS